MCIVINCNYLLILTLGNTREELSKELKQNLNEIVYTKIRMYMSFKTSGKINVAKTICQKNIASRKANFKCSFFPTLQREDISYIFIITKQSHVLAIS